MQENINPVLCFGTFFTLLLREGVDNLSTKGYESGWQSGPKNSLTEVTAFRDLNRIITPSFSPANEGTFAGQASKFKSCVAKSAKNLPIVNASDVMTFLVRFEVDYMTIYKSMASFVDTYIHTDFSKRERLIKSLLELIRDDKDIMPDAKFYVNGNNEILSKKELLCERTFSFVAFLIGVLRYIIENKRDDNMKGKDTYSKWCPPAKQALRVYSEYINVGATIHEKIVLKDDKMPNESVSIIQKSHKVDISNLSGIDRADYLSSEAREYRCNKDYEKALSLYYESWQIYQEVVGVESRCVKKTLNIMEEIFKQLDKSCTFSNWLNNMIQNK